MQFRTYEPEDYDIIAEWYRRHGLLPYPEVFMPVGLVVSIGDKDICAGFLHQDKFSPMSWINGVVSNPDAGNIEIYKGVKYLVNKFKTICEGEGYQVLAAFVYQESLTRLFAEIGFNVNHTAVSEMFITLNPK